MTKSKWMPLSEAVELVMARTGCSHHTALQKLAKKAKRGKLPFRKTELPAPELKPLSPQEGMRLVKHDPSALVMTLADFKERSSLSADEILGELRSGRLVASAPDAIFFDARLTGNASAADFLISFVALANWMDNPKTPQHLVAKFKQYVETKPS